MQFRRYDRQTDKQTDTDTQTDRQTNTQTDRQTQTDRHAQPLIQAIISPPVVPCVIIIIIILFPNNTTVCTLTSIQFRRSGQQGLTRTLTAALKRVIKQLLGTYSITQVKYYKRENLRNQSFQCCSIILKMQNLQ